MAKPPPDDAAEALFQRVLGQLRAAGYAVGDAALRGGQRVASAMARSTQTVEEALCGAKDARLFFRVPAGLRANLKALAAEENRKMDELLTEALVDLLVKKGRLIPSAPPPPAP